jgi:multidrug efflux pump subunit AcrB
MLASYALSRTLTPVVIGLLLKGERHGEGSQGWFARFHAGFDRGFERFRRGYVRALAMLLKRRLIVPVVAALMLALGGGMLTVVGRDFFPPIDGGQIKLHVRVPAETRIEATEGVFQDVEDKIRECPGRSRRAAIACSNPRTL